MRRLRLDQKVATTVCVSTVVIGGVLVGFVAAATAAGPSLTVTPRAQLEAGRHLAVLGRGFSHTIDGAVLECNDAAGEPATVIQINRKTHDIPIGCTDPLPVTTSSQGRFGTTLEAQTGTLGAWESGTDSAGKPAAADSVGYPCPPTSAQQDSGVSCLVEFLDNKAQEAIQVVTFKGPGTTTTTTSTIATTTTTTTDNCAANLVSASGGTASLTVDPGTCLVGGMPVSVFGSGFFPNALGSLIECNETPNQPTIAVLGDTLSVGCTDPVNHLVTTQPTGILAASTFTVLTGVVGPPATGTDSAGNDAATDAANYPCPPTTTQVAEGVTCAIVFGDVHNDGVTVPISFNPSS